MKKLIYIGLALLTFIACNRTDKSTEKEKERELQKQNREKIISELTDRYQINYCWDTLDFNYSINYDKVIESGYQVIKYVNVGNDITDIYERDSTYFISISTGFWPAFYFDLSVPQKELNKILNMLNSKTDTPIEGVLVVKISEIKKIKLRIESYPEDESYCSLEFGMSDDFIGKGQVVELITIN